MYCHTVLSLPLLSLSPSPIIILILSPCVLAPSLRCPSPTHHYTHTPASPHPIDGGWTRTTYLRTLRCAVPITLSVAAPFSIHYFTYDNVYYHKLFAIVACLIQHTSINNLNVL
jgi:hypothetical protein